VPPVVRLAQPRELVETPIGRFVDDHLADDNAPARGRHAPHLSQGHDRVDGAMQRSPGNNEIEAAVGIRQRKEVDDVRDELGEAELGLQALAFAKQLRIVAGGSHRPDERRQRKRRLSDAAVVVESGVIERRVRELEDRPKLGFAILVDHLIISPGRPKPSSRAAGSAGRTVEDGPRGSNPDAHLVAVDARRFVVLPFAPVE
jgi:hypothetical protein